MNSNGGFESLKRDADALKQPTSLLILNPIWALSTAPKPAKRDYTKQTIGPFPSVANSNKKY